MATTKRKPRRVAAKPKEIEIPGTGIKMQYNADPPDPEEVPKRFPYIFNREQVEELAIGVKLDANMALTGPTGCGKTSVVAALAAVTNNSLVRFNMNGETRVSHIVGMNKPVATEHGLGLEFSLGAFAEAMQEGKWTLLDEMDSCLQSVAMVLQAALEEGNRRLFIPETGEVIHAHPNFRMFATGNTIGYRATARMRHAGTNPMNDAMLDRFGIVIAVDYPERLEEIERVKANCPDVEEIIIDGICRCAEDLRKDDKFRSDFSTRRCVQWARLFNHLPEEDMIERVLRASEMAVVRKMTSPTDAAVAREVIRRIFGYEGGDE